MELLYPNDLTRRTLVEMAVAIGRWLHNHPELGGSGKHGRLPRICRVVEAAGGAIQRQDDPVRWRQLVQAFKDVQEYWYILEVLRDRLLSPPFIDPLKRSLSDPVLPSQSGEATTGRDAQFELFMAAAASRAGLGVDRVGERGADWELKAPTSRWSLEVKRIKSDAQVEKRIRKAAEQINARGVGGIIVLDISAVSNPSYDPLDGFVTDDTLHRVQRERGEWLCRGPFRRVKEWVGKASVGFLLVYDFVIRPAGRHTSGEERPWSLIGFWDKIDLVPEDSPYRERYDDLWALIEASLPDL